MSTYTGLALATVPAVEPVSLAQAKEHLRVTHSNEDTLIAGLIAAAREKAEEHSGSAIITQEWDVSYEEFTDGLELPVNPLQSVDSIKYLDDAGDLQTLATSVYRVAQDEYCWRVTLNPSQVWPTLYAVPDAITVRVTAGHGAAADDVPKSIQQAILLLVGHLYENREATSVVRPAHELPLGIRSLLSGSRNWSL